jgi:hypothetical protein
MFVLTLHILMTSISRTLYWLSLSVPCVLMYESSGMAIQISRASLLLLLLLAVVVVVVVVSSK